MKLVDDEIARRKQASFLAWLMIMIGMSAAASGKVLWEAMRRNDPSLAWSSESKKSFFKFGNKLFVDDLVLVWPETRYWEGRHLQTLLPLHPKDFYVLRRADFDNVDQVPTTHFLI